MTKDEVKNIRGAAHKKSMKDLMVQAEVEEDVLHQVVAATLSTMSNVMPGQKKGFVQIKNLNMQKL